MSMKWTWVKPVKDKVLLEFPLVFGTRRSPLTS